MIKFVSETHTYTLDGQSIPSVTKVLKEAGLIDFSKVNPDILERALNFGTAVHLACELYDTNDLNETTLDNNLRPYLDGWIKFLKDTGFKIESTEERVVSKKFWYAGTLDRRGTLSKRAVLDIKTGVDFGPATALQLAAYENGYNEDKPFKERIKERICVLLRNDGTYKMEVYKDKGDFSVFLSCLTLRNWRKKKCKA